jgi:hypothetical protein
VSDRTIRRPEPWENDFTTSLRDIAQDAETWAASIEDAHAAQTSDWESFTPSLIVHRTAAEYTAGTGVGGGNAQAAVTLTYGAVLVRYSWICLDPWYAASIALPAECEFPPCLVYARSFAGVQIQATADMDSITVGATGSLLAADMYLASVRYTASGAPEAGDWVLDDSSEQLGFNTTLT